jgi:CRISPR/Cas system-associated endoribonuclease Cas2
MNTYLVSYDLNVPGQKYDELYKLIKMFPDHIHIQDSVWIIQAVEDSKFIYDYLSRVMDEGDDILIIKVSRDFYGVTHQKGIWDHLYKLI